MSEPRLEQRMRLGQQQKLSPRMIQSMEILEMAGDDLEERVGRELETNVALERKVVRESKHDGLNDSRSPHRLSEDASAARDAMLSQATDRTASPQMLLEMQWGSVETSQANSLLGDFLLTRMDGNGFLTESDAVLAELAAGALSTSITVSDIAEVRELMVENLEPAGVGARDRADAFRLQLARLPEMAADKELRVDALLIIASHLDDLERNRLPRLARALKFSLERVQQVRDLILALDPSPLHQLEARSAMSVRPDAFVAFDSNADKFVVALSRGAQPSLRISPQYEKMAEDKETPADARKMLQAGMQRAKWFIEAIDQRATTLQKVVEQVVELQRDWLEKGPGFLHPMQMTQVAGRIGFAISTVSRAVAGKWIATPRGVIELRLFFSGGTTGSDGRPLAWDAVKRMVQELIAAEDSANPLSDERITKELAANGVILARRTVVKYRVALGIPSSRLRRRHAPKVQPVSKNRRGQ
ncbi:MAG: RNA polymerase factor sigma-54 [Planctomycetota bacterium]|nr:RNA polymerase factor sigma-54 [Planctomycetota bacterium]